MFKKEKEIQLDMSNIPDHIAFIMDGNGRWAKKRNMPRTYGHHEGTKTIRDIALECNKIGVKAMTVYAFSTENYSRPEDEVNFLFKLPIEFFNSYLKELIENNVRIELIGHLDRTPKQTTDVINEAIRQTKDNTGMVLCFAFGYGGRDEIVAATKEIVKDINNHEITINDIDESYFESKLMSNDLPDIDLMIRTSGEQRISNFMLWKLSYSEMIFTDTLWPDFNKSGLYTCIAEYQSRNRRYGGLK